METLIYDIAAMAVIFGVSTMLTWLACSSWDKPTAAFKSKPIEYIHRRNWAREYLNHKKDCR